MSNDNPLTDYGDDNMATMKNGTTIDELKQELEQLRGEVERLRPKEQKTEIHASNVYKLGSDSSKIRATEVHCVRDNLKGDERFLAQAGYAAPREAITRVERAKAFLAAYDALHMAEIRESRREQYRESGDAAEAARAEAHSKIDAYEKLLNSNDSGATFDDRERLEKLRASNK